MPCDLEGKITSQDYNGFLIDLLSLSEALPLDLALKYPAFTRSLLASLFAEKKWEVLAKIVPQSLLRRSSDSLDFAEFNYLLMRDLGTHPEWKSSWDDLLAGGQDAPNTLLFAALFWEGIRASVHSLDEAVPFFKKSCARIRDIPQASDSSLLSQILCTQSLESSGWIRQLEKTKVFELPFPLPSLTDVQAARNPQGGAVLLASCDANYFKHYIPELWKSLQEHSPMAFHANIINADPEALRLAKTLQSERPDRFGYSLENPGPLDSFNYYTCSRLVIAPALLDRYAADLILVDTDSVLLKDPLELLKHVSDADVGICFQRADLPYMRLDAELLFVKNSPGGRGFLSLFQKYVIRKIAEANFWTLDQAALYSLAEALKQKNLETEVRIVDLVERAGPRSRFLRTNAKTQAVASRNQLRMKQPLTQPLPQKEGKNRTP